MSFRVFAVCLAIPAVLLAGGSREYKLSDGTLKLEMSVSARCTTGVTMSASSSDLTVEQNVPTCADGDVFLTFVPSDGGEIFRFPLPLQEWRKLIASTESLKTTSSRLAAIVAHLRANVKLSSEEGVNE